MPWGVDSKIKPRTHSTNPAAGTRESLQRPLHFKTNMKLSIGIVGLPNVGKSTLFKIISKNDILIANYPFATIDPNVGVVAVPDARVEKLTEMSKSKKKVPAVVEFYDIAGLVKGAASGEGLGNQFLTHIRDVSAVVQVLRVFGGTEIVHVENSVDPIRDMDIINTELALKDLESVEKRLPKAEVEVKGGKKDAIKEVEALKKVRDALKAGKPIREFANDPFIKQLFLLTAKPKFYLLNGSESEVSAELKAKIAAEGNEYVVADLATAENIPEIITKAYQILGLISFFTTGEDETRAWTIQKGWLAPQAAGTIHTDFEKKFIRAEVVSYDDFVKYGSWSAARQKGVLRVEGKEYLVKDGDIMEIRHS
jgi:ribosome-binding ATPase YchF (GTP1/OBG family)